LNPKTIFFHVNPGKSATEKATLSNSSTGLAATINSIEIGTQCCGTRKFHVVSHTCGATLEPRQRCTITVEFIAGRRAEDTKVHTRGQVPYRWRAADRDGCAHRSDRVTAARYFGRIDKD